MRVRADQVRAGQRISGATVTKVRQTLERGTVRLTLENEHRAKGRVDAREPSSVGGSVHVPEGVADGTFCYRSGDILEVESPRV